jgi:hypothetical protein
MAALLMQAPAVAGEGGDITRDALYSGRFSDGIVALAPLAEAGDGEAVFGTALIRLVRSLETAAFQLYTHGLAAPRTGALGPALAVPLPPNPAPQPLDYEGVRGILEALRFNVGTAEPGFMQAAEAGDWVLPIDVLKIRIDANGDGQASDGETIAAIFGIVPPEPPAPPAVPRTEGGAGRSGGLRGPVPPAAQPEAAAGFVVGFDRADAYWFAGYSNLILMQAEFLLAHDFSSFVDAAFHRLFPRSGFAMQEFSRGGTLMMDPESDTAIADAIAAIHTLSWPVTDAEMLAGVRERALRVIALSRANWQAIGAETDDDRELIPNPRQTPLVPEAVVTEEIVAAWHKTLDAVEAVLQGELLVPHWRFAQGFDLRAYFESATRTDLVLLLTGYDALPYLKDGPVASAETFAEANRVFGNNLLNYAFWFN